MRIAAIVILLATAAPAGEKEIREALHAILSQASAKQRAKLVAALGDVPVEEAEAAVRKGPLYPRDAAKARGREKLVEVGGGVGGYTFEHDGDAYRYAVHVPSGYDPRQGSALLLDPGHGSWAKMSAREKVEGFAFYRGHVDAAGGRDWLIVRTEIVEEIGPNKRGLPEETGNRIFQLMFRDLATRYHFDPDRVYVTGLSQTGFWTWMLGVLRADRFAGIAPMGAVTWEVTPCPANLLHLPAYVLHGAQDPICPVEQPRETCSLLAWHGVPVRYHEIAAGKHDATVWGTLPTALLWLQEHPRRRYPGRVSKSIQTAQDGWCYWLRIDALEDEDTGKAGQPAKAGIDGELDGQTVRLHSEGVKRVTLCFASEMMDLGRPVRVIWNGKTVYEDKVERSLATMFELVYDKTDWKQTFEAALELEAP